MSTSPSIRSLVGDAPRGPVPLFLELWGAIGVLRLRSGRDIISLVAGGLAGFFGARSLAGSAEDIGMSRENRHELSDDADERTQSRRRSVVEEWIEEDRDLDTEAERRELEEFKTFLKENPL